MEPPVIPLCLFHGTSLYELALALNGTDPFCVDKREPAISQGRMHGEAAILWDALLYMNGGEVPQLPMRFKLLAGTNLYRWIQKFVPSATSYADVGEKYLHGYRTASTLYLLDQHGLLPTYPTGPYAW